MRGVLCTMCVACCVPWVWRVVWCFVYHVVCHIAYCAVPLTPCRARRLQKPSPKASSSFISNITFAWFEPMAFRGWRHSLQREDLWDLNPADRCSKIVPVFNGHWYKLLEKSRR